MPKKHTSSRLRHRLTLQQEIHTADTAGGYTRSWQDVAQLWVEIIPNTGNYQGTRGENMVLQHIQTSITHKILLRYRAGIDSSMRLVFENRIFNIRYVINSHENNETLEILAEEGVAA